MERDEPLEGGERPAASEVNRELTQTLVDVGKRMGFSPVTEYVVPGGRFDVVWLWEPASPIPGVVGAIPVAGFEIERWITAMQARPYAANTSAARVSAVSAFYRVVRPRAAARPQPRRGDPLSETEPMGRCCETPPVRT